MEIRLLGRVELLDAGRPVVLTAGARWLLGLLALGVNRLVPAPQLEDFGGRELALDADPGEGPGQSRWPGAMGRWAAELTAAFGSCGLPAAVLTRPGGCLLRLPAGRIDTARYERVVRRARGRMVAGNLAGAARRFAAASQLWPLASAGPLSGSRLPPAGWAAGEVTRLRAMRVAAAEDRWECELRLAAAAYGAAGGPTVDRQVSSAGAGVAAAAGAARAELTAALADHPRRPRSWELLLVATFLAEGRRATATVARAPTTPSGRRPERPSTTGSGGWPRRPSAAISPRCGPARRPSWPARTARSNWLGRPAAPARDRPPGARSRPAGGTPWPSAPPALAGCRCR